MTATEVNVRYELMQRLLGPTLGRLQNDLLDPLIQRTFNLMYRAKQLAELPEGLDISQLDIEYTGPLPRAQKAETAQAIDAWMMRVAEKAEVFPQAMDLVNVDESERLIAQLSGVPAKAMNSQEDIDEKRETDAEKAAEAEKIAAMQAGGDAMQSMGQGAQAIQAAGGAGGAMPGAEQGDMPLPVEAA